METGPRRTTIYDLARLAGVSASAVSSVLNGTWEKRRISKRLAERVFSLAEQQGYAVNAQASLLRRERSHIVGMIVPKYANRYFGEIAEQFEAMAREAGYFPVITCTKRDPELEFEAAKELISYQAECIIATGATDPDRISAFCAAAGAKSINLDLPGTAAPSVISDNFAGARELTALILDRCKVEFGSEAPLHFVGGRLGDHNTAARLDGFLAEHRRRNIKVSDNFIRATGYSANKAMAAMADIAPDAQLGLFVNSTISLEGVLSWHRSRGRAAGRIRYGCFDWDPFGALLPGNIGMVEQDVRSMLAIVFELMSRPQSAATPVIVPCKLHRIEAVGS